MAPRAIEKLKSVISADDRKPGEDVEAKIKRGREDMRKHAQKVNECVEFVRGNQYVWRSTINANGQLIRAQPLDPSDWRPRQVRNLIKDIVERETAAATQRVPAYQVTPSTTDSEDIDAARLSEKVALYGYQQWNVKHVTERVVWWAITGGNGFAQPYFDNTVGDPISDEYATGEVKIRYLGPNEVYWEPGVDFYDSRWHVVEQARPLEEVYAMPGYFGGKLKPDADKSDVLDREQKGADLVLVTEYLERPSLKNREGRRLIMAAGVLIAPEEPYPLINPKTKKVCDEPCLHHLGFFIDAAANRSLGLVEDLLDAQRTVNSSINKLLIWEMLALHPQILEPEGAMLDPITTEPGARFKYRVIGGQVPKWRETPPVPREHFEIATQAENHMGKMAAQNEIPSQVDSGKGLQAFIDNDATRRQRFISNLAAFHAGLMRHCLWLVQRHYTEKRLLTLRGRNGPENINGFMGAQLLGQADVTVLPASIEPRTREYIEQRVMTYAQLGWVSPEAAMAAIAGGTAENLIESYELDIARANLLITKIRSGGADILAEAGSMTNPNANAGNGLQQSPETPDWMPREFDNVNVQLQVFTDWMKTTDYDALDRGLKEVANLIYQGYKDIQGKQQSDAAAAQAAQAQAMGDSNAARPAAVPKLPSLPNQNGNN